MAASMSAVNPGLLLFVPLALALMALPPRRPRLVLFGAALLVIAIMGRTADPMWWFGRGWALVLGAWFVLAVTLMPGTGFINRGLAAVFGAAATAAILMGFPASGWTHLDELITQQVKESARVASEQWARTLEGTSFGSNTATTMARIAEIQATLHPALLALGSLCALAVTWYVWRRLTLREDRPLARLREFRFRDELIWLVVVAVILLVLPLNEAASRTGINLAVFMAALYAVRGLAVVISLFGMPGPLGAAFGLVAILFLFPVVSAATLVLGLSDTWLDLRSRARLNQESK